MSQAYFDKARFVVGLVALAAVSAVVGLSVWAVIAPPAFGWSPVAVMSGSMEPLIGTGDIVVVEPSDGEDLAPGTVIVFVGAPSGGQITHRVVEVSPDGDYVTRGDANGRIDSTPVSPDAVIGVGRMLVPGMGQPLVWVVNGQWVMLLIALLIAIVAAWASRWALLSEYDPWLTGVKAPPVPGGRHRPAMLMSSVIVVVSLLAATMTVAAPSRAIYAASTDNVANSAVADVLQPPTALTATGGGDVTLNWTITSDTYASGHRVFRSTSSGGPYTQIAEITPRATASYVDSPPNGTYYYVVRAYTTNWESTDSNEDTAVVVPADDYDAVVTASDNCPTTFNIDQFDTDNDTIGDACDASPTVASTGLFTDNGQSLGVADSRGLSFGDVDGDGDLDAIVANDGNPSALWLNNGSGTFADSGQTLGTSNSDHVALADLDGDGDLDAMIVNDGNPNTVWLNNGSGSFSDSGQTLGTSRSRFVMFGDVDGDGDLDAIVANDVAANEVWLNNGAGTFSDSGQTLGSADGRSVAVGDVDGDSDLDVMFVNDTAQANRVWLNNGSGTFSDSGQTLGSSNSEGVVFGDVDGDGDLDAIVANNNGQANRVWLNNGTGTFSDSGQALGSADSRGVVVGDIDGDGDLDAMFANDNGQANRVWLNNGSGTFSDSGQTLGTADSRGVALGDLDGDGDLDAMIANVGVQPNTVWLNDAGPTIGLADFWQSGLTHVAGAGSDRVLVFVASNEQQSASTPTLTGVTY
ncbi:MAG: signal peptidase I, partial [Acidimicrobiales bacterium]|nr:signal peptidase I [Acidimicrobiales bacterium]